VCVSVRVRVSVCLCVCVWCSDSAYGIAGETCVNLARTADNEKVRGKQN